MDSRQLREEFYFDVQGASATAERIAELIAKISTGALLTIFAFHELSDELAEYRELRRTRRKNERSSQPFDQ